MVAVAADARLRAMDDPELYEWARAHGRRVVTENAKDLRLLVAHRVLARDQVLR